MKTKKRTRKGRNDSNSYRSSSSRPIDPSNTASLPRQSKKRKIQSSAFHKPPKQQSQDESDSSFSSYDENHKKQSSDSETDDKIELLWYCPQVTYHTCGSRKLGYHVPNEVEYSIRDELLLNKKERGMMKDQPVHRYKRIKNKCKSIGMRLYQALSLRRQMVCNNHPGMRMNALGLGHQDDVKGSADQFEKAVERCLRTSNIPFLTENEQRVRNGTKRLLTPDFLIPSEHNVILKLFRHIDNNNLSPILAKSNKRIRHIMKQQEINWIEVKMYYGEYSIYEQQQQQQQQHRSRKKNHHRNHHRYSNNNNSSSYNLTALLIQKVKQYVKYFGKGAMIFMFGCNQQLAIQLERVGVIALDCTGDMVDLRPVQEHQKTWCANTNSGLILP